MEGQADYRSGWPEALGEFEVLIDGQPDKLRHWQCELSGRHEWIDSQGHYIRGHEILWRRSSRY